MRSPAAAGPALALALACVLAAPSLRAQSEDELETARAEFSEALSQEAAGDWAGALEKMEKVGRVKLTAQVRYHFARCKEHLGRYTEALGDYKLAEYEAKKVSAPELEEITRARQDLEARVPKLLVSLPPNAAGTRVKLDGVELGPSELGIEIPVNPGRHRLAAKLGEREWYKRFKAREGHSSEISLKPPARAEHDDEEPPRDDSATESAPASSSPLPWVAVGVGAAGFISAGVFYDQYNAAENDLNSTCRHDVCPSSAKDLQDKSDRYRILSGVALGVGILGAGVATVLFVTQGSSSETKTAARLELRARASASFAGLGLQGSF